jgi:hypothetical protein
MRKELLLELVVFGIVTVVFNLAIYWIITGEFPSPKLEHFNQMLLASFLLGSSIHLTFEVLGFNERWCRSTYYI